MNIDKYREARRQFILDEAEKNARPWGCRKKQSKKMTVPKEIRRKDII